MRKMGYYGILESQECTKWWNMPPALRISRFISNDSAQPGKLIKGCSQACTERAATAQGGCCCFMQAGRRDFVLFHFHVWSSHVPIPPPRRWQSVPTLIASALMAPMARAMLCIIPQRESHWRTGTMQGWSLGCSAKPRKAHDTCFNCPHGYLWPAAMLMPFPQFQGNKEKISPSYPHFRQIGSNKAPLLTMHWASAFHECTWAHIDKWQSLIKSLGSSLLVDQYNSSASLSTLALYGSAEDQVGQHSLLSECHDFYPPFYLDFSES